MNVKTKVTILCKYRGKNKNFVEMAIHWNKEEKFVYLTEKMQDVT